MAVFQQPDEACPYRPQTAFPQGDYEVRVHVDFKNRLIRPLRVSGVSDKNARTSEILVFTRDRCRPDCAAAGCRKCRRCKLYQDLASNPKGAVAFVPHNEYLYCLRLHRHQPARAILLLTPREQHVEVKELGLLAYWFSTWFQRAEASGDGCPTDYAEAEDNESEEAELTPMKVVAVATAAAADERGIIRAEETKQHLVPAAASAAGRSLPGSNSTSRYLPNLCIIYQVKQERMTVSMPEPQLLSREIDILLVKRGGNTVDGVQTVTLRPGAPYASQELTALRDTPYTLMVRLKDLGSPLKLLDLVTEKKVLRVQESLLAPKHMNFLMERRVDQRATFVLHITFDEKGVNVDNRWLGDFYLDVDFEKNTLNIGTTSGNERKMYRVEELLGPDRADWTKARRVQWFEGGVDASTLFIRETIPIHMMTDYLITVIDPDSKAELPTSVLCIGTKSLYVKEVKGSDVRLNVTVQRQFDPAAAAAAAAAVTNGNNCPNTEVAETANAESHMPPAPVRRSRPDGMFHCPIGAGCARYRIQHNAGGTLETASSRAATATEEALSVADACCSSDGVGCDDSGIGRNAITLSENSLDSLAAQCQQRRRQQLHRSEALVEPDGEQEQRQRDFSVNLDVDLPKLQARLLPAGATGSGGAGCYLIVEDSVPEGHSRSIPCQLGQSFAVQRWCRYTVKAIGDTWVTPLFTFRLTDTDVIDILPCNPTVRLTKNVCHR